VAERPTAAKRSWRFPVLCGVGALVVVLGVLIPRWVVPTGEAAAAPETAGPDLAPLLTRFAVTTVVVLAACAVTARVCGNGFRPRPARSGGPAFEVLEAVPVGSRCCVHLVRAGDELLLAGVDATGLKSLLHLAPAAEPEVIAARITVPDLSRFPD
jgi:flagellar biogenesis protein FliO